MAYNIFYSWQSDTKSCYDKWIANAIKSLKNDKYDISYYKSPTGDKSGAVDILVEIKKKISECDCYICDLSIVGQYKTNSEINKNSYNSNVLIELGFAIEHLDNEQIIILTKSEISLNFRIFLETIILLTFINSAIIGINIIKFNKLHNTNYTLAKLI